MSFFDRLFGTDDQSTNNGTRNASGARSAARSDDEIAVERYRYLLRTAPPETIEQVHRDAFSKLTPQQRDIMFDQLTANSPRGEQPTSNDAASLATAATRSELRSPGTMERSLTGGGQANAFAGQGMGFAGTFGSSMLGTVAGYVVASSLMSMFLPGPEMATDAGSGADSGADSGASDVGADAGTTTEASGDAGADFGGGDAGGDFGGGFGDFGDFGF